MIFETMKKQQVIENLINWSISVYDYNTYRAVVILSNFNEVKLFRSEFQLVLDTVPSFLKKGITRSCITEIVWNNNSIDFTSSDKCLRGTTYNEMYVDNNMQPNKLEEFRQALTIYTIKSGKHPVTYFN